MNTPADTGSLALLPQAKDGLTGRSVAYVPVEWFKGGYLEPIWPADANQQTFLSSGTTGSVRTASRFSAAGLAAYRQSAIQHFAAVLRQIFPDVTDAKSIRGISLIPPVSAWPDSSLAQMLTWFAEQWDVQFVGPDDLAKALVAVGDAPTWIFGTTAHWLHVAEAASCPRLLAHHLIFETGGSKNLHTPLDRQDFYRLLRERFAIADRQIVSEYGMSELSAQAYDYIPANADALAQRRYKFAPAVEVSVMRRPETIGKQGVGALLISDPARVDLPWPIRTQDVVELGADGSFVLQGRVPLADVRGCSLRVESILAPASSRLQVDQSPLVASPLQVDVDLAQFARDLRAFFRDEIFHNALAEEFGSAHVATCAVEDLLECVPKDAAAFAEALRRALPESVAAERWLLIAPASHSIAAMYPLVFGVLSRRYVSLRMPTEGGRGVGVALRRLADFLVRNLGVTIEILPNTWRISGSVVGRWDAVLAFGADTTLRQIRELAQVPVASFGDHQAVAMMSMPTLAMLNLAIRDAFSLGQFGCRSARALIIPSMSISRGQMQAVAKLCQLSFANFWQTSLSDAVRLALDHEALQWHRRPGVWMPPIEAVDSALFPQLVMGEDATFWQKLPEFFASRALVLPIIWLTTTDAGRLWRTIDAKLAVSGSIRLLSADLTSDRAPDRDAIEVSSLGCANRLQWNGLQHGVPLFACQ